MTTAKETTVKTAEITVKNPHGLHLRCCSEIAQIVSHFKAGVTLSTGNRTADASSTLAMITLMAVKGTCLTLTAKGADAAEALDALCAYFNQDFTE